MANDVVRKCILGYVREHPEASASELVESVVKTLSCEPCVVQSELRVLLERGALDFGRRFRLVTPAKAAATA